MEIIKIYLSLLLFYLFIYWIDYQFKDENEQKVEVRMEERVRVL